MRLGKTVSVEELQVVSRFEGLRKMLLSETYADHLDKPLAYWALPTDRRLPLAFLGARCGTCSARRLSNCRPRRASGERRSPRSCSCWPAPPTPIPPNCPPKSSIRSPTARRAAADGQPGRQRRLRSDEHLRGDVGAVAGSVVRHGLAARRSAASPPVLQNMTRVIWNTPLGAYTSSTLAEIRAMKTHGEKRIRAILEVFHAVHTIVAGMGTQEHLVVRIVPRSIDRVEQWIGRALQRPGIPDEQEIFANFVQPLLEQVRIDATQQIATLAENRLGIGGPITSVRQAARTMGLTRARVYQLLNEINDIMMVRWPTGRHQSHELRERFQARSGRAGPRARSAAVLRGRRAVLSRQPPRRGRTAGADRRYGRARRRTARSVVAHWIPFFFGRGDSGW